MAVFRAILRSRRGFFRVIIPNSIAKKGMFLDGDRVVLEMKHCEEKEPADALVSRKTRQNVLPSN